MLDKIGKYYHTLKYLKWTQIKYRLWYKLYRPSFQLLSAPKAKDLQFVDFPFSHKEYMDGGRFSFLNIEHDFHQEMDWNYPNHGKLWTYNLNYFAYLCQADLSLEKGLILINDFIGKKDVLKDGLEPYPISLRSMYWIKFLLQNELRNTPIDDFLFSQLKLLSKKVEYHLLGNHLLENGFAFLMGGMYFSDASFLAIAKEILIPELKEQILDDGAHFELSPMYHCIILSRLLDGINLVRNNPGTEVDELLPLMISKAGIMLGWLREMCFSNGDLPRFNDSTDGISLGADELLAYAERLKIQVADISLNASGYRKLKGGNWELIADLGNVGPDYIPGHAHSDTFSFVLYKEGHPILIDPGISTYEKNQRRNTERSTASHNTVMVEGLEQTEVWGGFRVARRAKITDFSETETSFEAMHSGYERINCTHRRKYERKASGFMISDFISEGRSGIARFHFHPSIKDLKIKDNRLEGAFGTLEFSTSEGKGLHLELENYDYAVAYNQIVSGIRLKASFITNIHTFFRL